MSSLAANEVISNPPGGPLARDDRVRAAALALLRSSGYRPLTRLGCEVRNGTIFLSGVVPTFYLKQMAQALLLRLEQAQGVRNLVEVR